MTAYSFKPEFRALILDGTKRQTIRADRKRHARPGEQVQLYTGMRTRQCRLIGRAVCSSVMPVRIGVSDAWVDLGHGEARGQSFLDGFARLDGFANWANLAEFWRHTHPDTSVFSGVLIAWSGFVPGVLETTEPHHAP